MVARLIWLLVILLAIGILVLFWMTRDAAPPEQEPEVGVTLRACAEDPAAAGCV